MATHEFLSVIVPVYNDAPALTNKITTLLDVVPDLTQRFEILVVDDGSEDQTAEVAYELARIYPQVLVAQHAQRRGRTAIVETALSRSCGEILFVQDENAAIDSSKFQRLWSLRDNDRLAFPMDGPRNRPASARRIAAWGVRLEESDQNGKTSGVQMIRRPSRAPLGQRVYQLTSTNSSRTNRVDRQGIRSRHSELARNEAATKSNL